MNPASVVHGPALIGIFLNLTLYGIMITQTFLYFSAFKHDHTYMKAYVMLLFLTDTANSIFNIIWIYNVLINNFGNERALEVGDWVFATDPAIVGLTAAFSELFFAWRIKVLTQNWWLVSFVGISAIVSALAGLGTAAAIGSFVPLFKDFHKFTAVVIIWHIAAAVCDSTIAVVLSYVLRQKRTGFSETDDILDRIVKMTIQTGFLTAVWSVADLVCFLAVPTAVYLVFNFPLAKLHTNAVMSSLNSRGRWKYARSEDYTSNLDVKSGSGPDHGTHSALRSRGNAAGRLTIGTTSSPQVFVDVETHEMVDVVNESSLSKKDLDWSDPESVSYRERSHDAV